MHVLRGFDKRLSSEPDISFGTHIVKTGRCAECGAEDVAVHCVLANVDTVGWVYVCIACNTDTGFASNVSTRAVE